MIYNGWMDTDLYLYQSGMTGTRFLCISADMQAFDDIKCAQLVTQN